MIDYLKENWIYLLVGVLFGVSFVLVTRSGNFLDGNTNRYTDSVSTYSVKFDNDTMVYLLRSADTSMWHKSSYELVSSGDSAYAIVLEVIPGWWIAGHVWTIIKADYGFYSEKTGKQYYKN